MTQAPVAPAWSVHLPTVDATCVRLALPRREAGSPWPFTLAVTELSRLGATGAERFRSLGAGRVDPLLASQELSWRGLPLHLEAVVARDGRAEASLELPSWDELVAGEPGENDLWDLVDTLAAALGARHGCIGDGEPLGPMPGSDHALRDALRRHPALLVGAVLAGAAGWHAADYRTLPLSDLHVLLR